MDQQFRERRSVSGPPATVMDRQRSRHRAGSTCKAGVPAYDEAGMSGVPHRVSLSHHYCPWALHPESRFFAIVIHGLCGKAKHFFPDTVLVGSVAKLKISLVEKSSGLS